MKLWSIKYNQCQACNTVEFPHVSRGLCRKCYSKEISRIQGNYSRKERGNAEIFLTKEKLIELYVEKKLSLSDIGKLAGTSRANVCIKLKKFQISARTNREARDLALEKGKLTYYRDISGERKEISLKRKSYNKDFFKKWSDEMAYVLGLIFTDGNVCYKQSSGNNSYLQGSLFFGQKDLELVQKFSNLIEYTGKIGYRPQKLKDFASELFYIQLDDNEMINQLEEFNIFPNKSKKMILPEIPVEFLRHFIRGLWDGDGTVYIEKNNRLRASFVSGSKEFINSLALRLEDFGLSKRNLYEHKHSNAYYFRYVSDDDCLKLYNLLYKDVAIQQYYTKKYEIFRNYFLTSPSIE